MEHEQQTNVTNIIYNINFDIKAPDNNVQIGEGNQFVIHRRHGGGYENNTPVTYNKTTQTEADGNGLCPKCVPTDTATNDTVDTDQAEFPEKCQYEQTGSYTPDTMDDISDQPELQEECQYEQTGSYTPDTMDDITDQPEFPEECQYQQTGSYTSDTIDDIINQAIFFDKLLPRPNLLINVLYCICSTPIVFMCLNISIHLQLFCIGLVFVTLHVQLNYTIANKSREERIRQQLEQVYKK